MLTAAAIYVHKANDGNDEVVVDLSPLRSPLDFAAVRVRLVMAARRAGGDGQRRPRSGSARCCNGW